MHRLQPTILAALSKVYDPDLKQDLISLGMIDHLLISDSTISFTLILTTPACPLQNFLKQACIAAIREQLPDGFEILIEVTAKVTTSRSQSILLPGVKNIIAIASGKGGVGKSTIATHLALALANHGAQVGLLDGDIFGPSIPMMWGCQAAKPTIRKEGGKSYIKPIERHGVKLLSIGFVSHSQEALVWRGPMASAAFKQLLQDGDWGSLDYLLVDLPPGTSDIHLTLVQSVAITGVVIVTTPQRVAQIDAIKAIAMFQKAEIKVPILGIVENMAYFIAEGAGQRTFYSIFGKEGGEVLAASRQLPFLGQVPLLTMICQQGDQGIYETIPVLQEMAQRLAQEVAIRNNGCYAA